MKYGYARVSTRGQASNGNSMEDQVTKLKAEGCEVIYEEAFTGTKKERPQFQKLLSELKAGDTLVVTKLDRFARSISQGNEIIEQLLAKGVIVDILNLGRLDNSAHNKMIRGIFLVFAEFERDMIVERTQEGKAIAKQHEDFREGRPNKYTKKQMQHALGLLESHSYTQVEQLTGISKSTLIRAKKKPCIKMQSNKLLIPVWILCKLSVVD